MDTGAGAMAGTTLVSKAGWGDPPRRKWGLLGIWGGKIREREMYPAIKTHPSDLNWESIQLFLKCPLDCLPQLPCLVSHSTYLLFFAWNNTSWHLFPVCFSLISIYSTFSYPLTMLKWNNKYVWHSASYLRSWSFPDLDFSLNMS